MSKPSGSGIREKFRSDILKKLALEKSTKRKILDDDDDDDIDNDTKLNPEKKIANGDLLSILPKPQNSSFGPTIKLDKILKAPQLLPTSKAESVSDTDGVVDDVVDVDVSKFIREDIIVEKPVVEKSKIVVAPKEKQKNQITYLAQLGKATELERKDQAAQSRFNKSAARAKYGW